MTSDTAQQTSEARELLEYVRGNSKGKSVSLSELTVDELVDFLHTELWEINCEKLPGFTPVRQHFRTLICKEEGDVSWDRYTGFVFEPKEYSSLGIETQCLALGHGPYAYETIWRHHRQPDKSYVGYDAPKEWGEMAYLFSRTETRFLLTRCTRPHNYMYLVEVKAINRELEKDNFRSFLVTNMRITPLSLAEFPIVFGDNLCEVANGLISSFANALRNEVKTLEGRLSAARETAAYWGQWQYGTKP